MISHSPTTVAFSLLTKIVLRFHVILQDWHFALLRIQNRQPLSYFGITGPYEGPCISHISLTDIYDCSGFGGFWGAMDAGHSGIKFEKKAL
jgi:hypothetical protein